MLFDSLTVFWGVWLVARLGVCSFVCVLACLSDCRFARTFGCLVVCACVLVCLTLCLFVRCVGLVYVCVCCVLMCRSASLLCLIVQLFDCVLVC